jgi:hypothetical protein
MSLLELFMDVDNSCYGLRPTSEHLQIVVEQGKAKGNYGKTEDENVYQ